MAVKQIMLPTGTTSNEERKKGMLMSFEREIELLKTLQVRIFVLFAPFLSLIRQWQHPNIVTYLDSSTDGTHLNIFLECR